MSGTSLRLRHQLGRHVEVTTAGGALLFRYIYMPDTPINEARRPYAHPVCSLAGDVLTNFRPNDHPWHHALSLTLTSVNETNFWGGPSHARADGYRWRADHGEQRHRSWFALSAEKLEEELDWSEARSGVKLLSERRTLTPALSTNEWSLIWTSELRNVTNQTLLLGNYHANGGLEGSHYTGLQFRGARDLLDEHGDAQIGISAEGDLTGEGAVHGAPARWMEWSCQHDGSLRRTKIRFENLDGALPWFVRSKNPVAAFAFHREQHYTLQANDVLRLQHRLTFTNA